LNVARAGEISQEGKPYYCPAGSFLTFEKNGSGNHVCQDVATGRQFQVVYRNTGSTSTNPSSGQKPTQQTGGTKTGGTSGGGSTNKSTGTTKVTGGTSRWMQPGADLFAQNPEAMLAALLDERYGDNNSWNALYDMLAPYGDAANVMFLATTGQNAEGGTKEEFLNYLENYWDTLQTPGGRIDWETAARNILNPQQNSPLASYLLLGAPQDQAANFIRLMAGVTDTSFHPLVSSAIMNRIGHEADRYIGQSAKGMEDPFVDYFKASLPYYDRLFGVK